MFAVVAKKSRTFTSVSPVQLMSRWAGAGREQSQADSPSWPVEIFHTIDVMLSLWMWFGWGAWILSFSGSSVFSVSLNFFGSSAKSTTSMSSAFHNRCSGPNCHHAVRKNCIVCNLFCMFVITIFIIISFVVLLNCLYLNPWVLPFVHSPPHPTGGKGRVCKWMSGA